MELKPRRLMMTFRTPESRGSLRKVLLRSRKTFWRYPCQMTNHPKVAHQVLNSIKSIRLSVEEHSLQHHRLDLVLEFSSQTCVLFSSWILTSLHSKFTAPLTQQPRFAYCAQSLQLSFCRCFR